MLITVVKRECIDHLLSLRFSFALVLVVGLMILNALGFAAGTYPYKRDGYLEKMQASKRPSAPMPIGCGNSPSEGQATYTKSPAS